MTGLHVDSAVPHFHAVIYVPRRWQTDHPELFERYYRALLAWRHGPVDMQPYRPERFGRTAALGYLARCGMEYVRPFGTAPSVSRWDKTR